MTRGLLAALMSLAATWTSSDGGRNSGGRGTGFPRSSSDSGMVALRMTIIIKAH